MMNHKLPLCCKREAFELLGKQAAAVNSSPDALLYGAVAIAMNQMDDVDPARVDRTIQRYADAVRRCVRGPQPQATLAHLHDVLFETEGFTGNIEDYYNPSNSYLPAVLESKQGLPITLCLLYKLVAERLGLHCWGVGLPGHFLIGVRIDETEMLIDPFSGGRLLTRDEIRNLMEENFGPNLAWSDDLLQPISPRHWLTRMLQNLLHTFGSNAQYAQVGAILEMEMLLWPTQDRLQRDLALVLARIGLSQPASVWLNQYLRNNPDDPQRRDLKQLLEVLST